MKNLITISVIVLVHTFSQAQPKLILDTIYANEHKNVALFFPAPIRQGITGAKNFVFTYNRDQEQYFGLLQAKPGKESNLLIINNNGSVFSYIVKYKAILNKLNYFVPESTAISNENPSINDSVSRDNSKKDYINKTNYYERLCTYLIRRKQRIGKLKTQRDDIIVKIENIVFDKEEFYFVVSIKNRSTLDYDVNFLNLTIQTRKKGRKKSLQELSIGPLFTYNVPTKIRKKQTIKFVYVVPKFSISDQRLVLLNLNEANGERHIKLKIKDKIINNPN